MRRRVWAYRHITIKKFLVINDGLSVQRYKAGGSVRFGSLIFLVMP